MLALRGADVALLCLDPRSGAGMGPVQRMLLMPLLKALLKPVSEGAAPLLWAATSEAAGRASGTVFDARLRPVKLTRAAGDAAAARQLWADTERLLGLPAWGAAAA